MLDPRHCFLLHVQKELYSWGTEAHTSWLIIFNASDGIRLRTLILGVENIRQELTSTATNSSIAESLYLQLFMRHGK
ncbi:hypothetical protein BofuT4_uP062910.1 [Botrytis cinerea T4]|uniref:Uncharacterized protein n=1 Tax=Botryotinia fuckeliana (strain T4) TaxID=999810 RepID=G2XTM5_BOTF4|nr:hypothetical protein BofuT4_uP062910.1 [Botrytis cinerea T4]